MRRSAGHDNSNVGVIPVGAYCNTPLQTALPEGWVLKNLNDACNIVMGQSPPGNTYNKDRSGLPFFQGKAEFGVRYPTVVKWCSKPKKVAYKNDVLISVRAPVGPTNIASSECCIGRGLAAIRPLEGTDYLYVFYYLRSIEHELAQMGTGSTFKAISGSDVKAILFPLAPLNEQKLIVSEIEKQFSRLDEAVAALKRIKANLKRYKASVLKAAVEGKLTEGWRRCSSRTAPNRKGVLQYAPTESGADLLKRILAERRKKWEKEHPGKKYKEPAAVGAIHELPLQNELPKGWVWATIEQVSNNVQYGSSSKTSVRSFGGTPVLRMGNIVEGKLTFNNLKYLPKNHAEFPGLLLIRDDILFNRTNSPELVGKTAVYHGHSEPCSFASYLIRVQVVPLLIPEIISYYINSSYGRNWIKSVVSQQVGQANVNGTKLQALAIPIPSVKEQGKVVEEVERRLSVAEEIEVEIETNLKRAERLRQSILKKAFSGRLI
ncbi:MAG: restriction endonuclease subunit S [Nitrospirae bacterium]|nr:restriction endonuclease subunit S [Nitrospirota bacterium]